MKLKKRWWVWTTAGLLAFLAIVGIAAWRLSRELEPYIKAKTIEYLRAKFDSDVEIGSLGVRVPWRTMWTSRRLEDVRASGSGIAVRYRGRRDIPPLLALKRFEFRVDVQTIWAGDPKVRNVRLEGLEINMPPKGERPARAASKVSPPPPSEPPAAKVYIDEIIADGAKLTMLPKDPAREPLQFDMQKLKLEAAGVGVPMKYITTLMNAKPPGLIQSLGTFGPWNTEAPGETPVDGKYRFEKADLGVFKGIDGILESEGAFTGPLNELIVDGWANVPDFRLHNVGQAVPLKTRFHAFVDGTNGNTLLEPVDATLGDTSFTAKGGVVRNKDEIGKTVDLAVVLQRGNIQDLLRLAVKGAKPFLRGGVSLNMKLTLPPGKKEVADRLQLAGSFNLINAHFTSPDIKDKISDLSQRSLGQPDEAPTAEVATNLAGSFNLRDGVIRFSRLAFTIPGARVDLDGQYVFGSEELDFHGTSRTEARLSEMMKTRWKRWALKPIDPVFAKEGYGTVMQIAITGTRSNPSFGLDHKKK